VTTSDDEPTFTDSDPDAPVVPGDTDAAPYGSEVVAGTAEPAGRLALGILAGVLVALLGIAVWAIVYAKAEREFVGVSVVTGLAIGWTIRTVSRRSTMLVRIVAVLLTAAVCVGGTLAGEVAFTSKTYHMGFWKLLGDVAPDTYDLLSKRPVLTFGVFVAALVLAYLAAAPQKPKAPKGGAKAQPVMAQDEPIADPLANEE
jgi:hypothetical protein